MFAWAEIGQITNRHRYDALSVFLNENGFENSVDYVNCSAADLGPTLTEVMKSHSSIRIGRGLGEVVLSLFTHLPLLVNQVRAADSLVIDDGRWWPRAFAAEGFRQVLVRLGKSLDFSTEALIVGSGAAAKVAVSTLFGLGFRRFAISSQDPQRAGALAEVLRRVNFGAEFTTVPRENLILLSAAHGIVVNTTPIEAGNPLLEELHYFNFLKQGGVAVDFTIESVESPLLKSAADIGALVVHGYEIAAITDMLWAKHVSGRVFDLSHYQSALVESLKKTSPKL